jgi:hypothetical protein
LLFELRIPCVYAWEFVNLENLTIDKSETAGQRLS